MLTNAKKSSTVNWKRIAKKLAQVIVDFNDDEEDLLLISEKDYGFAKQVLKDVKHHFS
jgi:hypothetical protein